MSTRCNIDFYTAYPSYKNGKEVKREETKLVARVYKHWDGYPDGIVPLFKKFRKEMLKKYNGENKEARGYGHMINNGEDMAAEFIRMFKPDFGDISVCIELHQDIAYLYELHTWYGMDGVGKWTLKVYEIDNWDDKENKKLIKTIELE